MRSRECLESNATRAGRNSSFFYKGAFVFPQVRDGRFHRHANEK